MMLRLKLASLALSTLTAGLMIGGCANAQSADPLWVASWSASPHAPLTDEGFYAAASFENVTISQVLRLSEGGTQLRVRFTNRYGSGPLTIGEARVFQIDAAGAEIPGTSRALTFGGQAGAVIPRGSPFASETVDVDLPDLSLI
jgi:hypothetical protein